MNMINIRSKNWEPLSDDVPMYKKTPNSTGIGIRCKIGVNNMDKPTNKKIMICVTRCSRTPKNCGFSPGAEVSDSIFKELTCVIASTVAATNHGKPNTEHNVINMHKTNRSKW